MYRDSKTLTDPAFQESRLRRHVNFIVGTFLLLMAVIGTVITGVVVAMLTGLITEEKPVIETAREQVERICINNGGYLDTAYYHMPDGKITVSVCAWKFDDAPSDSKSGRTPRTTDPEDTTTSTKQPTKTA
jgi:hypothetical protein